jgi:hypothetical protein
MHCDSAGRKAGGARASLAQILKVAFDTIWSGGLTFDDAYRRRGLRRVRTA